MHPEKHLNYCFVLIHHTVTGLGFNATETQPVDYLK